MDWRIFFIGPMGPDTGGTLQPSDEAARRSDHFDEMIEAVVGELVDHGYRAPVADRFQLTGGRQLDSLILTGPDPDDRIILLQPHALFGTRSIHESVFDAIDDADLIVVDLSELRPAVVYELAFAHALGIWTILLSSTADEKRMFYVSEYRHVVVDFDQAELRTPAFRGEIAAWLEQRDKRSNSHNPLTDFYRAPLPDISAAFGLATGYYENFLRHVLAPGSQIVTVTETTAGGMTSLTETRTDVSGVLVVRPSSLRSLGDLVTQTRAVLQSAYPERFAEGDRESLYVQTPAGRRTCEFVIDGWLIDVPRTVLSLARSPRITRANQRSKANDERSHGWEGHVAAVLIERFLDVSASLLLEDRDVLDPERRLRSFTPAQIVEFLRS